MNKIKFLVNELSILNVGIFFGCLFFALCGDFLEIKIMIFWGLVTALIPITNIFALHKIFKEVEKNESRR